METEPKAEITAEEINQYYEGMEETVQDPDYIEIEGEE